MRIVYCIVMVMIASSSFGQDFRKYFGLVSDINIPLSNKDFIKNVSTKGAKFIYREMINEKFTAGAEIGYASYYQYTPPMLYTSPPNTQIYTDLYGYVNNYSVTASGEYYFVKNSWIMPYAGFGLGVTYSRLKAYYNIFGNDEKKFGGLFRPHTGVLMRFGKTSLWGAMLAAHYDYATIQSKSFGYKNFSNLGFQIGLFKMVR